MIAQSVINAFQVLCAVELPDFDLIDEKAAAMKMHPQFSNSGPSAGNTVTRSKGWAGNLTDGPFTLELEEMSGTKGKSTSCAIVADVPDRDAFRAEAIRTIKLPAAPAPELRNDGSRSYFWDGAMGPGTTVVARDFAPSGKPGVMLKLLSMVATANNDRPKTAAEWATKIAFTIRNNPGAATSASPIMSLVSAISRDNVVEIKYVMKDAAGFARLKQNSDSLRLDKTSFYCNASRISYLTEGVVFHEITASPGGDDIVELTIDRSSCDTLPKIARLDPASIAKLAISVANSENNTSAKEYPPNGILQFGGASAHEGVVEERFILPTYSAMGPQVNATVVTDVSRGFLCNKYRNPLLQGVTFHRTYVSKDGGAIFDFSVDGAHC